MLQGNPKAGRYSRSIWVSSMFKLPLIFYSQDSRVNQKIRIPYPIFIVIAIILSVISACGVDLVKTSATGACQSAIDSSEWDKAISNCTGKDLGDAYMGKGGYNVGNLMSNSGGETTPSHITDKNAKITTVDSNGAKVLYIIGTAYSQDNVSSTRKSKIEAAKKAFDDAITQYTKVFVDETTDLQFNSSRRRTQRKAKCYCWNSHKKMFFHNVSYSFIYKVWRCMVGH